MALDTYKVSAWNSHKKYDFDNTQISRVYFAELANVIEGEFNPSGSHERHCGTRAPHLVIFTVQHDVIASVNIYF